MDDLEISGTWTSDFLNYVEFVLYLCKDGIYYNGTNPNCTSYEKLMNYSVGNTLDLEFFIPDVQFQIYQLRLL